VATGGKWDDPKNRSNRPIGNRWQPTARVDESLVQRSTQDPSEADETQELEINGSVSSVDGS